MSITRFLVVMVALIALSTGLQATILPTLTSQVTVAGITTYTYNISLEPDQEFLTSTTPPGGYFLTLFDFNQLVPGSPNYVPVGGMPTGTISVQNVGLGFSGNPPNPLFPADNASIPNITLTFNVTANVIPGSTAVSLGTLTAQSTSALTSTLDSSYSQALRKDNQTSAAGNRFYEGPSPQDVRVPEPATSFALGSGLTGLALLLRKLRKS